MPTVIIGQMAVTLPRTIHAGEPMTDWQADLLNEIWHRRVAARLRWLLKRGQILPDEIQSKIQTLLNEPLVAHTTFDDYDGAENDPVMVEAMTIARDLIVGRMAAEGLPPPKGLDQHARALVEGVPEIQEQARKRVEARYVAATAGLGTLTP
jgi:hypothetical protein